ncbi:MAG: TIGR02186 family protein [Hyphomicrobium sp.]|nr:TIGR02186 family protein [Hyphomicrobium sp.]
MRNLRNAAIAAFAVLLTCLIQPVLSAPADLPRETVEADVSTRSVSITSGFTGMEIIIFGTVENSRQPSAEAGTYDVVVVVEGTTAPAVVRKKARVGGLWINSQSMRFASFPAYYAIASTRPIDEIADADLLTKNEIGFKHINMKPAGRASIGFSETADAQDFRLAVLRLKQRDGLYVKSDYGVGFIGRSLFRSTITLPPNVPVGPLTARVYLLRDGQLLSSYTSKVTMERAGVERFLHDAAFERPLLYGIAMIVLAALAGLSAAFAFSRISA